MTIDTRIGVDIGGTFTDAVAVTPNGILTAKVPSNPQHPGKAVLQAVEALGLSDPPKRFLHGTTLVTNMLLERKGSPTGLITSKGMRDIVHIGRHERPLNYAIKQEIAQQHHPPIPRKWRFPVAERVAADGEVIHAPDEKEIREKARNLINAGVEAIAICFLHSYRYPEHERQVEKWVQEESGDIFVCTSSEVSPRFREYERFLTTAWNARVAPNAARYLAGLARELSEMWPGLQLTLMSSNGGLEEVDMTAEANYADLRRTPIRLGLSGPAAAGNAVIRVTSELGLTHCVGLDVGGTSSDIVVVRDGRLREAPWEERSIGDYPLQIPMLDLHTIGAGGGSLVHRDDFGALHVGPQSAGANPGPACYNRGGTQATVTDAAVIAGRLPADILLGGKMPIKPDLAKKAFQDTFQIQEEGVIKEALDVLALAEANIAFGIRERTVSRGLDPSELALVAAGGAGSLLACGVAEQLELAEVIVPHRPGLLAAWGLLVAPDRRESAVTVLSLLDTITPARSVELFKKAYMDLSAPPPEDAVVIRTAALRYMGQGFEVEIKVEDPARVADLAERFHIAHEAEYGFSMPHAQIEWVELRIAWEKKAQEWSFPHPQQTQVSQPKFVDLYEFANTINDENPVPHHMQAALYHREQLAANTEIPGPAIIVEQDATTYIPSRWQATVTQNGYLRIRSNERK